MVCKEFASFKQTQSETQTHTQTETQTETQGETQTETINKLNKTELNKTKIIYSFVRTSSRHTHKFIPRLFNNARHTHNHENNRRR